MLESSEEESPFRSSIIRSTRASRSTSQIAPPTQRTHSSIRVASSTGAPISPSELIDQMLESAQPAATAPRPSGAAQPPSIPGGAGSKSGSFLELDTLNQQQVTAPPLTPLNPNSTNRNIVNILPPLDAPPMSTNYRAQRASPIPVEGDAESTYYSERGGRSDMTLDDMLTVEVVPRVMSMEGLSGLHKTLQSMVKALMSLRRDVVHTQQQMQSAEISMRVMKLEGKMDVVSSSLSQHPSDGGRFVTTDYLTEHKEAQRRQIEMLKSSQLAVGSQQANNLAILKERVDLLTTPEGPIPSWIDRQISQNLTGVNQQLDRLAQENRDLRTDLADHKRQIEELRDLQVQSNAALTSLSTQTHLREEVIVLQTRVHNVEQRVGTNERDQTEMRADMSRYEGQLDEQVLEYQQYRDGVAAELRSRAKVQEKVIATLHEELDETSRLIGELQLKTNNNAKDIRTMSAHIDESDDSSRERISKQMARLEERVGSVSDTLAEVSERTKDTLSDLSQWRIMADVRLGATKESFLAFGNEIADIKSELSAVLTAQGRVEHDSKIISDTTSEHHRMREQIASLVAAQQQLPELLDASLEEMESSIRQYVKSKVESLGATSQSVLEQRLTAASEGICGLLGIFGFDTGSTSAIFVDACREQFGRVFESDASVASLLQSNRGGSRPRPGYASSTMETWLRSALLGLFTSTSPDGEDSDTARLKGSLVYLLSPPNVRKGLGGCNLEEQTARNTLEMTEQENRSTIVRRAAADRSAVGTLDTIHRGNKLDFSAWSHRNYHEFLINHQHIVLLGIEVAEINCMKGNRSSSTLPSVYDGMIVITRVDVGQPGYNGGLQEDDLLVAVNNKEISGKSSLMNALQIPANALLQDNAVPWVRLIVRRGLEGPLLSVRVTLPR